MSDTNNEAKEMAAMMFEWDWSKCPADPSIRQELADEVRKARQHVFRNAPSREELRDALVELRSLHHKHILAFSEVDASAFRLVQRMRRDWEIHKARHSAGGLQ
jgi:hypothetical protein